MCSMNLVSEMDTASQFYVEEDILPCQPEPAQPCQGKVYAPCCGGALRQIESIDEKLDALEACLVHAGILTQTQVQVQLHRQRFDSICKRSRWKPSLDAELCCILYQSELVVGLAAFVGKSFTHALALTCSSALRTVHEHGCQLFVLGGYANCDVEAASSIEGLNPFTGTWEVLDHKMPVGGKDCASVVLGGRIYLCGIGSESSGGKIMSFDPSSRPKQAWKELKTAKGSCTPRHFPGAAALGCRLYVCGGVIPHTDTPLSSVERIDPSIDAQWEALPAMSEPRASPACSTFAGKLLACGGDAGAPLARPHLIKRSCELFDPDLRVWTAGASMMVPRSGHRGGAMRGCVYVAGGYDWAFFPKASQSAEFLSCTSNSWTLLPPMQIPRAAPLAVVLGRKLYVCGGVRAYSPDARESSTERFDPDSGRWEFVAPMHAPRCCHSGGVLAWSGLVL